MIKPHQFVGIAAASAMSVLLAFGLYFAKNPWSAGNLDGTAFVPDLAKSINSVAAIEVTQGGKALTIDRAGQAWTIRERGGFPAKPETARSLLVFLVQSQLVEPRTSVKDKLALLELEDPAGKDAKSRRVRILDGAGKPISDIVLGKSRVDAFGAGKGGVYVRRTSETQSWLATGEPKVSADLKEWVDTKVFASDTPKVTKLTVETPGEEPLVIEKSPPEAKEAGKDAPPPPPGAPKDGKFRLAAMPDGKKLKQGVTIDSIVEAFGSLDLDDVRKLDAAPASDNVQVLKLESEGGPVVTFRLRKDGDASWLSLSATGPEGDAKKRADEINAKAQGWEYKIPNWKAEQIGKRRADLFETS